ncbi:MAG: SDR family NAD(P)-dependent oxidoreductase, partial [Planctomycetaceae bacterium]|nr:SDR family NAD(P)-dependent oxidoreductase [Planctomycetaceae bacterium]
MELKLKGGTAIVTGGASGIGRAVVEGFAAEGVDVALWDFSPKVVEVADEIRQRGVRTLGVRVDITDEGAVRGALEETIAKLGSPRHLVHCAAIGSGKFGFPFTNLVPADWPKTLEV